MLRPQLEKLRLNWANALNVVSSALVLTAAGSHGPRSRSRHRRALVGCLGSGSHGPLD